jgi:hypothetical protein
MSVARARELIVPITAAVVVLALAIATAILSPPESAGLTPGSSFSKAANGTAAAYQTLQRLGYPIRRSFDPLASLAVDPAASVIVIAEPKEPASEQDRRALRAFVSAGGTVLVSGCDGVSFLSSRAEPAGDLIPERTFHAMLPSPLSSGVPQIAMAADCTPPDLGSEFVPLYGDARTEVVRSARIGRGLAVWWAGSTPIANRSIERAGHLELLLNVMGPRDRTILWDEFYHGQRRSLWSYARATPLPWLMAQMALAGLVAAAMYVRRRVPVRSPFIDARISPLEFVETMAGLYGRAASAGEAIVIARLRLRRLLLGVTGLAPATTDARLASAVGARLPVDAVELKETLETADRRGGDATVTAEAALPIVRRLQTFASMIDHRGG